MSILTKNLTKDHHAERLLCTPWERDEKELWLFRPYTVSALFQQALGENWHLIMYDEYYQDFWNPVFKFLADGKRETQVLELDADYQWGLIKGTTTDMVDKLMNSPTSYYPHGDVPLEFVAFRNASDGQVMIIHIAVKDIGIADVTID